MSTPRLGQTAQGTALTCQSLLLLNTGSCVYSRALENNSMPRLQDKILALGSGGGVQGLGYSSYSSTY